MSGKRLCARVREQKRRKDERLYKTELCKTFKQLGYCPYGDKCRFAHGTQELRHRADRDHRYKTVPCHQFWLTGACDYGHRCLFIHRESEEELVELRRMYVCPRASTAAAASDDDEDHPSACADAAPAAPDHAEALSPPLLRRTPSEETTATHLAELEKQMMRLLSEG